MKELSSGRLAADEVPITVVESILLDLNIFDFSANMEYNSSVIFIKVKQRLEGRRIKVL